MNRIREVREQLRISQIELARRAGVSQPFIHDLENGNRNARPETMRKVADALGVPVDTLKEDQDGETA